MFLDLRFGFSIERKTQSSQRATAAMFLAVLFVGPGVQAAAQSVTISASREEVVIESAGVTPLGDDLDAKQGLAQELALAHPALAPLIRDQGTGQPLRAEVFAVYPARVTDVPKGQICPEGDCYRADIYNFALNETYSLIADVYRGAVVGFLRQAGAQADLPVRLTRRAIEIATTSDAVIAKLGFRPDRQDPTMPNVKTALNRSSCERSRHLCVAPTFLLEDRALWAIVDLTEDKLVGIRWTDLGSANRKRVTEESIKSEQVFAQFCRQPLQLEQDGWSMEYILTSSDGLQLSDIAYKGRPVLRSVKLVDWHVSYSKPDGFGYSDAVGCPMFSAASVLAYGGPEVVRLTGGAGEGFALVQDFRQLGWPEPCHYRYGQRYEFYLDGRFRVVAGNLGRGCGTSGVYRPVLRIDLAPGTGQSLGQWDGNAWKDWESEGWLLQDETMHYTPEGYALRVRDEKGGGYFIEPGRGQFGDGGRGDNAFIYVTRYRPEEGDADMVTIGPCCNTGFEQGPEKYIGPEPEPIRGEDLVLWYVARMENDNTPGREYCWADNVPNKGVYTPRAWPCYIGPMFTPIGTNK
jgi:hypothetical protein